MLANLITLLRVLLTFSVIVLLEHVQTLNIVCISTIALIFFLDAVDGIVARKRNEASEFGARLDIIADRVIEMVFWVYFTAASYLPFWIPIVILMRGILTDNLHHHLTIHKKKWMSLLTRSLICRGGYGILKMVTFGYLATIHLYAATNVVMLQIGVILAISTATFCILRGLPLMLSGILSVQTPSD